MSEHEQSEPSPGTGTGAPGTGLPVGADALVSALAGAMASYTQQLQVAVQGYVDQFAQQWQEVVQEYVGQFAEQWQAMLQAPVDGPSDVTPTATRPPATPGEPAPIDLSASRRSLEALSQTLLQTLGRTVEEMTQDLHGRVGGAAGPVDAGTGAPATPEASVSPTIKAGE